MHLHIARASVPPNRAGAKPGLREKNKAEKRAAILKAARELFAAKGFEKTTIQEIARRAGVGTGTIFLYAKDKPALLFWVFQDEVGRAEKKALAALPKRAPLLDKLFLLFRRLFYHYAQHPSLSEVYLRELIIPRGESGQQNVAFTLEFLEEIAKLVDDAKSRGEVHEDVSSLLAASNFFAIYYFALLGWLSPLGDDRESQLKRLRRSLHLQIDGLGGKKAD
ncbi:MAG: TetR/AcrR family transcriptional regulator [Bdellovibrionota bacterium]